MADGGDGNGMGPGAVVEGLDDGIGVGSVEPTGNAPWVDWAGTDRLADEVMLCLKWCCTNCFETPISA